MHTDYMHKGLSKTPTTGNQGVLAVPSYNARVVSKEKWLEDEGEQGRERPSLYTALTTTPIVFYAASQVATVPGYGQRCACTI